MECGRPAAGPGSGSSQFANAACALLQLAAVLCHPAGSVTSLVSHLPVNTQIEFANVIVLNKIDLVATAGGAALASCNLRLPGPHFPLDGIRPCHRQQWE